MNNKPKIYLDTSVLSALYDMRLPDRQSATEEFFNRKDIYGFATSEITRQELAQVSDMELRKKLMRLLEGIFVHPVTTEMTNLAGTYVKKMIFTPSMYNDAAHVAASVLTGQHILVSWNFKHLVNRLRRAQINELNISMGMPMIEIISPPEV